jgi:hypothetical protein
MFSVAVVIFLLGCGGDQIDGSIQQKNNLTAENQQEKINSTVKKENLDALLSSGKCSEFHSACIEQGVPQIDCDGRHKHCINAEKKEEDSTAQERRKALWKLSIDGKCDEFKSECSALKLPQKSCEEGYKKCAER